MTMHTNLRRITLVTVAALTMALGAGFAVAQPAGGQYGPGAGGPHGFGPGGPHGAGAGDQMIGNLIERAKTQLNLNAFQQKLFETAVADAKLAREAARTRHQQVKDALQLQLGSADPDLAAVAKIADAVEQQNRDARRQIRDEWLNLYSQFNADQKAIVRDMLQKRMAHAETFRQKMHEWMQQHRGATSG